MFRKHIFLTKEITRVPQSTPVWPVYTYMTAKPILKSQPLPTWVLRISVPALSSSRSPTGLQRPAQLYFPLDTTTRLLSCFQWVGCLLLPTSRYTATLSTHGFFHGWYFWDWSCGLSGHRKWCWWSPWKFKPQPRLQPQN